MKKLVLFAAIAVISLSGCKKTQEPVIAPEAPIEVVESAGDEVVEEAPAEEVAE